MLYIYDEYEQADAIYWHVGEEMPTLNAELNGIQADGHELEFLYEAFPNLPKSIGRVVVWKGAWAGFILDNIQAATKASTYDPGKRQANDSV